LARGARRAKGKRSYAISDRSGFKVPYKSLKTTWDGLRVEPEDWEPKHPQLTPAKNVIDATALFQPRPDNDPENVDIFYGYNYDPFIDPRERPPVGIPGFSRIGFVNIEGSEDVTGVAGTGAIGSFSLGVVVTGAAGTGATGTATPNIVTELDVTGLTGTGALGSAYANPDISGASGTGATGTEALESDSTPSGVAGTGAFNEEGGITFTAQNGAQLSTAQQKFGTASLLLDGVDDNVVSDQTYNFGSNVFTVDMWVRPTSGTQDEIFYDSRDSTSNNAIALRQASDNLLVLRGNVTLFNINNVFSANTWVHIAVARGNPFSNTYSVYVNGTIEDSTTFGVTATAADIHIGSDFNDSNNWAGYIDELRISDTDRYSGTSFTVPSTSYDPDANTVALLHFDGVNGSTSIVNSTGTSVFEADTNPSGQAGTGSIGTEVPESESTPSGVVGTGAIEGFGIEGDGVLQVLVTGVAGVGATGTTGSEVAESEISETGLGGTGNIGAVNIQVDYGWGEGTWSEDVWGE